ncbi:MAG: hypothetical protein WCC57_12195 [Paracoccaceae bacterium]
MTAFSRRTALSLYGALAATGVLPATAQNLSMLLAPTLMVHQFGAIPRFAAGCDGGWQPHVTGRPQLAELVRFHAAETLAGSGLLALAATGRLTWLLMPISISMMLAVPLSLLVQTPVSRFQILNKSVVTQ